MTLHVLAIQVCSEEYRRHIGFSNSLHHLKTYLVTFLLRLVLLHYSLCTIPLCLKPYISLMAVHISSYEWPTLIRRGIGDVDRGGAARPYSTNDQQRWRNTGVPFYNPRHLHAGLTEDDAEGYQGNVERLLVLRRRATLHTRRDWARNIEVAKNAPRIWNLSKT